MKKICISAILSIAIITGGRAADISVNNSGQPGTYTTITAALAAAAPNDRVFVSPYGDYTENLILFQNVTLASAVSGTVFNVVGTMTINGAPNMDVRIIGAEFSGALTATTGGAGLNTKAEIYVVESSFSAIIGEDFVTMHILYCTSNTAMTISMRHGEIRGCTTGIITIPDGPNAGVGDTLFIVGNYCDYVLWQNDDNYFFIANNFTDNINWGIRTTNHHFSSAYKNLIINNTLIINSTSNGSFRSTSANDHSNIYLYNNILQDLANNWVIYINAGTGNVQAYYNYIRGYKDGRVNQVTGNTDVGYGYLIPYDALGRSTDPYAVDQGSPALEYYDIDLTRSDRGTFGGPYSIDNYTNTATGKARVYDLEMPFEIWTGQTPAVKAKGVHTK